MPLRAATTLFGVAKDKAQKTWKAPASLQAALDAGTAPRTEALEVYVNHGRWVVDCPDCRNAQLAHRTDHRFLCNNCGNGAVDGLWRLTVWPDNAAAIEQELERRADPQTQNWHPGETVVDLRNERIAHTVGAR